MLECLRQHFVFLRLKSFNTTLYDPTHILVNEQSMSKVNLMHEVEFVCNLFKPVPCDLIILECIWKKNPSFFKIYLTRTILIFTSSLRPSAILVPFVAQYLQIEHVAQITKMYPKTTQLAWFQHPTKAYTA